MNAFDVSNIKENIMTREGQPLYDMHSKGTNTILNSEQNA